MTIDSTHLLSYAQAKAAGHTRYQGNPCAYGHVIRLVCDRKCVRCAQDKKQDRYKNDPDYRASNKRSQQTPQYLEAQRQRWQKRYHSSPEFRKNKQLTDWYRRETVPNVKIAHNLRIRLYQAVRGYVRSGSAVRDLGCSLDDFKTYIEQQFQPGMSWDNWTHNTWHLDHKRPLASFDLGDREQFLQAVHYTNLQPLWAVDNMRKGAQWQT